MKRMNITTGFFAAVLGIIMAGCTTQFGQFITSSHYVYPNSNVTPLGATTAKIKKTGIIFPSQIKKGDYENLFNKALSKHQGADVILDMGLDVKYTRYPIPILNIWITEFTLTGTAASVEVGEQELSLIKDQSLKKLVHKYSENAVKK